MTKIIYQKGDVLSGTEPFVAHGCNNKGVMGSGVAKLIREKFPVSYEFYRWNYTRHGLQVGDVLKYEENGRTILHWITQNGYGYDGKKYVSYEGIESCIKQTNSMIPTGARVAMPKIGAGLGGGDWFEIEKIIVENADFIPFVYEL